MIDFLKDEDSLEAGEYEPTAYVDETRQVVWPAIAFALLFWLIVVLFAAAGVYLLS